jgi:glycosyltransferase involved in cell wall biosynthesis
MVRAQIHALTEYGHDVHLVSRDSDTALQSHVEKLRAAARVAFGFGISPIEELLEIDPEIVIVNNLFPNYATSWINQVNVPKIYVLHNYRLFCATGLNFRDGQQCFDCTDKSPISGLIHSCYRNSRVATLPLTIAQIRRPFINNEIRDCDRFVSLSDGAKSALISQGLPADKISVIPNFIELSAPSPLLDQTARNGRWVAAGRLSREKGFLNLVENWPDTQFLDIIGSGPDQDVLEGKLKGRTNIRLLGHLPREQVLASLPEYSGAIHPSLWQEVCPLTVIEYLASGLPVITLSSNTSANLIAYESAGVVLGEFTSYSLSSAINEITAAHGNFINSASKTYLEHFTKIKWVQKINQLMQDLTSS